MSFFIVLFFLKNSNKKATVAVTVKKKAATPTTAPTTEPSAEPTATPAADALKVTAVTTLTSTKINVTFSKSVDETVKSDNFKLSDGASVSGVEFNEDRTVATLVTNGLVAGKEYTLTVSGVTAGEDKLADYTATFTAKKDEYKLELNSGIKEGNTLKADGTTSTNVKVSLLNDNDEIVKDADSVELKFDTTAGNFANKTVTVQNGVAENTFTSESLVAAKTALITVTIINAKDTSLINTTATMNIVLDPNPETTADATVGATLTDIKVQTADRVALFFNREVDVKDYVTNNKNNDWIFYQYDADKLQLKVTDGATKQTVPVYALSSIPGNSQALYAYLGNNPWGRKELTDNAVITVEAIDKTKKVPVTSEKSAVLQDITNPSLLSVTNDGLTKLVLTFSEPVNWNNAGTGATNIDNYVIDGVPLKNAIYGVTGTNVGNEGFNYYSGVDGSNIVTITLGKNAAGKQIYLNAGKHSIQASNIGDVANITDTANNKLITQSLDFTIDPDDTLVDATVEVQSPEQYVVTLNRAIDDPVNTLTKYLKLQVWNAQQSKYVDVDTTTQSIEVKAIANTDNKKFIVQTTKDWTVAYDTAKTHKNYYNDNYRLHIDKDLIENPANGKKNAEINMLLDNTIMTTPDVTSPEIKDVKLNSDKKTFDITLSEPVQVPGMTTVTPNQTQKAGNGVPNPTVAFIKSDNSVTIPATLVKVNDYDDTITVQPQDALSAGTWKVVVYSISDDIGNTAATLVKPDFEVKETVVVADDTFKALWIVAVPAGRYDPVIKDTNNTGKDVVYVKYNRNIATAGSSANVVSTANYQVNGYTIPTSTKIDVSIDGYNKDVLDVYGINSMKDTIAISLNAGTLASQSNNIYLAKTLQSAAGKEISNGGLKTLDKTKADKIHQDDIFTWNYKTVSAFDTVAKLKAAITSDENVNVTAATLTDTDAAKAEYTISKAMTVDFANNTAKSLTIDSETTGTIVVKNVTVTDLTINAPYADVQLDNVKVTGTATLKNVLNTLDLDATCDFATLTVTADVAHAIKVAGKAGAKIGTVNNNAKATVTFDPIAVTTFNQNSAQKVVLDDMTITTMNIKAAASLVFDKHASTITTLNVQKDVTLASVEKNVAPVIKNVNKDVVFDTDNTVKSSTPADLAAVSAKDAVYDNAAVAATVSADLAKVTSGSAISVASASAISVNYNKLTASGKELVSADNKDKLGELEGAITVLTNAVNAATNKSYSIASVTDVKGFTAAVTTAINNKDVTVTTSVDPLAEGDVEITLTTTTKKGYKVTQTTKVKVVK